MRISDWSSDVCSSDLGCAHCIDLHTRDLLKTMPLDKVVLLPVWAEVPYLFDPQYRAALAWAEEVTRASETHASDEAYAAAAAAFEPRDLVDLTIAIAAMNRSEEHTSELQSLMRISYAVFCLKKKKHNTNNRNNPI